ncbi:hypothetical protein TSYNTROPHJE_11920 [Tepidanaerobacter syntrophicus]|uniref:hypothetical protein n=1 Tax=Tepidanaerobacter syntrophicus TaxID=224999 RepID=UPI0022EF91D2|nr:hypothetical protein [Tepidanaerobacter syntrophicus]GLI19379.1 hypothetical protein TSYNTROPHJE_11920 [Tepidanaerobacter syntrophicus]
MDAKFDRVDAKFESMKKEMDLRFDKANARFEAVHKEIKDLSDKTDAKFEKIEDKFDALNKWAVGSAIAVLIGTISVIATLLLK